jgi:hypothetical protein
VSYSGCVFVALDTQHAKPRRRIKLSFVACQPVHFSKLSHKRHVLRKNVFRIKCVLIFSTIFFAIFLILRRIQRDTAINVDTFSCKVRVILVIF